MLPLNTPEEPGAETYLRELDRLSLRDAGFELDGLKLWQVKELCAHLKIDPCYEGRERKPKAVLVAAIYEVVRRRRERVEAT